MKLEIYTGCDIGRIRTRNEDMLLAFGTLIRDGFDNIKVNTNHSNGWIAVSDGMGGHQGGAYASQFILIRLNAWISEIPIDLSLHDLTELLIRQIQKIHKELNQIGQNEPDKKGLGATFVGLLFYQNYVLLANIGDSRLYRYRNGILAQLTKDHTLRAITGENSVSRSILTNSFGGGVETIEVDIENLSDRFFDGDWYLLCSDGLYEHLGDTLLSNLILIDNPASQMIRLANESGGSDNISVVVVKCAAE